MRRERAGRSVEAVHVDAIGPEIDAEGVAWSMNYMTQVGNTSVAYLWNPASTPIKEIKATDKYTLQITTSEPVGNMEYRLLYAYILPKSVWEKMTTPDEAKAFTDLIPACTGTGAFKCVEWGEGDHLIVDANPEHWRGKPAIDRIKRSAVLVEQLVRAIARPVAIQEIETGARIQLVRQRTAQHPVQPGVLALIKPAMSPPLK